jgi:hypothetical protein
MRRKIGLTNSYHFRILNQQNGHGRAQDLSRLISPGTGILKPEAEVMYITLYNM